MQITETNLKFKNRLALRRSTNRVIVHHSASSDVSAATIHGWHLNQGWSGIGYHFVIRRNGNIERGRELSAIGSHSGPKGNGDSVGVCLTGNFEIDKPTAAQINSLVWLITRYLEPRYGSLQVVGHSDVMATACPGKNFPWADLKRRLEEDDDMIYKTLNDVPDWGRPLIKKLIDRKSLAGDGKGNINLPESTLKALVILEREGVLK
jgi:N-acetyl-anhydromuramyl-L-alanine amidase AmpD